MTSLPVSRLIRVSVTLTPKAAQAQNLSTLLVLVDDPQIDVIERMREYGSIDEVAAQFGTSAPAYLAADLWFEQAPEPSSLLIGRWAKAASAGQLVGGTLLPANQVIGGWSGINNGSFSIAIDGGAPVNITGMNFTGAANLNAVAAIIDAAVAGASVIYDANFQRFVFTSATTGAASSISFLGLAGSGTDISAKLAGTLATSAYRANGIVAESAVAAAALFDLNFGQRFYAVEVLSLVPGANAGADTAALIAVSAYIEGTNTKHLHGITTQEASTLSGVATDDIGYQLKALGYKKSVTQYSSVSPYAVASLLGRALTVDYNGNNTVITLMYKQEPGIVAENLNTTQVDALEAKNVNVFVAYNNDTAIIERGTVSSGEFLDTIVGADWLAVTMMTALYNLLYTSPTKIPQTDAGTHLLTTTLEGICGQGVTNGLLAPGTWNSAGFGTLKQGDFLAKGFYVYAPSTALQLPADRAARKSVPIQVAAKLAGAVHTVDVAVVVNQ